MDKNIILKKGGSLNTKDKPRYILINKETGEIVDDAQGYGYKTPQAAYSAYAYKTRDVSKDAEREKRKKEIKKWLKSSGFGKFLDQIAFEIAKGSWGPDDEVNSKLVAELLKDSETETDYSPSEILRVWRKDF